MKLELCGHGCGYYLTALKEIQIDERCWDFNKWGEKVSFNQNNLFLLEIAVPHPIQSTSCAFLCHLGTPPAPQT